MKQAEVVLEKNPISSAKLEFERRFGAKRNGLRLIHSPGRVNLIGEHTDYNEGFVLPMALQRGIAMVCRGIQEPLVSVYSADFKEERQFSLQALEKGGEDWSKYLRAVCWALRQGGYPLQGCEMAMATDLPPNSGLSSSAALELGMARVMFELAGLPWKPVEMARLCQKAENEFIGVACGIMDQLAVAATKEGCALRLDCRSLEGESIPVNFKDADFVIVHSGVKRGLAGSEYNLRRSQCEQAVEILQKEFPGVRSLRDVNSNQLAKAKSKMPKLIYRRAEHVVTENARVQQAAPALQRGDVAEFGALMFESHQSLKNLYEVSCPELDTLVELAARIPGVNGARLTGAGFGGCTVNLVARKSLDLFCQEIPKLYHEATGLKAQVWPCQPGKPTRVLEGH